MNKLTKIQEVAKNSYYRNELSKHHNDVTKQWKIVNEIISHKKFKRGFISTIADENNCRISDRTKISNLLNKYFINVGPALDAAIPKAKLENCSIPTIEQSFCFGAITPDEVHKQLCMLNLFKASGPENVSNKL